ncbi:MAG: XRE family transcriptional regulator [Armatimonadetes bacterium]|nr:XRE family transcriptional regulator [Armatimonadota bacterium]
MSGERDAVRAGDNVFAELQVDGADTELEKAQLAHAIRCVIAANGLAQAEAAKLMGTTQPKVSAIKGGRLAGFTSDRLLRYLRALECDVEVTIRRKPEGRARGRTRVVVAL